MARHSKGPRLERNQRGIYEIRWTEQDERGQSRSRRLSTRTDALAEAQATFAGWLNEEAVNTGEVEPTMAQCIERYRDGHVRAGQIASVQRAEISLRWLEQHFGSLRPGQIEDRHVNQYVEHRRSGRIGAHSTGVTDASIRRELVDLKAALNFCVRKRCLSADKVPHITLPDDSEPREFWLTETEWRQLEDRIAQETHHGGLQPVHRLVLLAYYTASRVTPIIMLTPAQIEGLRFVRGDPQGTPKLIRYDQLRLSHGKRTKKRRVAVPVGERFRPWMIQMLTELAERYPEDWMNRPVAGFEGRRMASRYLSEWSDRLADELDNDRFRQLHPHALRHTRATHLLRAGASLWDAAGVLGDSVATVERTYGHHAHDHLARVVDL
jgi:site-specific recombinase XerD